MHLTPHEQERLLHLTWPPTWPGAGGRAGCGSTTRRRSAIITDHVLEGARDGRTVAELMAVRPRGAHPRRRHGRRARDARRGAGRGDVPGRHQARHRPRADRAVIPGEIVSGDGRDRVNAGRAADRRSTSSTPATGRSRSARTTTSPRPTRRWSSTAPPRTGHRLDIPAGTAVRFEPGHRARGRRWSRSAAPRVVPGPARPRPEAALSGRAQPRAATPQLYGPTTGDRIRLADTDLLIEVTEDRCGGPGGGDEAVFGGGKVIRESMGQSPGDPRRGRARHRHHRRGRPRPLGHRQGRRRHPRRPDRRARQGRQPRHHGRRPPRPGHRPVDRDHRRQRQDPHRRRIDCHVHFICPQIVDEALGGGHHHAHRRRHRPGRGHARPPPSRPAPGTWPGCSRRWTPARSTSRCSARATPSPREAMWEQLRGGAGGFKLHEDWGTTPGRDRRLPDASPTQPGVQVAIHTDTLNEAGFVEDTLAAIAGRVDPRVPHRGRGRRPRAGHHHRRRAARTCCRRSTNPTRPHTVNTARRAPRHADGLPPPQPGGPRGPGVRREPHPAVDDRRRGRPARPRRDLDDRLRLAGDGPHRRGRRCAPGRPRT